MSVPLVVFTWNLHGNRTALQRACRYLARRTPCIVSFQELPEDAGSDDFTRHSRGLLRRIAGVGRGLAIAASADVTTANERVYTPGTFPMIDQRMIEVTITNTSFQGLRFFALHLPGRRDLPEGKRDGPLAILASAFHAAWKGGPVVLAGDFNADPYHREIAARGYFWAIRDRGELLRRRAQLLPSDPKLDAVHGGRVYPAEVDLRRLLTLADRIPLYNPMWTWLPERGKHPRGTHYYLDDDCGISWHCYDQILLSPELVKNVQALRILSRLGRTILIDGNQKTPIATGYSDHLPVELVLDPERGTDGIKE